MHGISGHGISQAYRSRKELIMNGILIVNAGGYWVARANKYFSVTAPTAHAVVRMLQEISQEEELDYSA